MNAARGAAVDGATPRFWLNLQQMRDLDVERATTDVGNIEPLAGTEV